MKPNCDFYAIHIYFIVISVSVLIVCLFWEFSWGYTYFPYRCHTLCILEKNKASCTSNVLLAFLFPILTLENNADGNVVLLLSVDPFHLYHCVVSG